MRTNGQNLAKFTDVCSIHNLATFTNLYVQSFHMLQFLTFAKLSLIRIEFCGVCNLYYWFSLIEIK